MRRWYLPVVVAVVVALVVGGALTTGAAPAKKEEKKGKEAVVLVPPGEDAVQKANAKVAAGQTELAISGLAEATTKDGMTGEPFLRLGQLLENTTEVDRAIAAFKGAGERLTDGPKGEALARLSVLQEMNGVPDEATASAEAAMAADAEGAWPAVALARVRARQGKGDEALALAQKAVAAGTAGTAAQTALGLAQEARGDLAAAQVTYRAATTADPSSILANLGLARVLRSTGRAAEADPLMARVNDKAPWFVDGYKEAVQVKMALGQFVAAMEQAQTAAALNDRDPAIKNLVDDVKVGQALDYVKQGGGDLAAEDMNALLAQRPDFTPARVALAKALITVRKVDLALVELGKAIATDPNAAEAHFQIGVAQQDLKRDIVAALPAYEKAVALAPLNVEYRLRYGNALAAKGQSAKAIEELLKAAEGPGASRPDAWIYLGGAYLSGQRYEECVAAGEKALTLLDGLQETPLNKALRAQACDYLAWAYLNRKDKDNVLKYGLLAKELGQKDDQLFARVAALQKGENFAGATPTKPVAKPVAKPRPGARPAPRR
jgi:tetratricopeptide (TPR) repeat protein